MKVFAIVILLLAPALLFGQAQQPFVFTAYGGLFFPSGANFKDTYGSASDLIYGGGIGLPLDRSLFLTADYSWFKPRAIFGAAGDSSLELNEKILHVGLLSAQPLTGSIFLRLQGGFNLISATATSSGPAGAAQTAEADRRIGYYGGFGLEEKTSDPHVAFFADLLYDYRRSRATQLYGDIGGLRVVIGAHLFLF